MKAKRPITAPRRIQLAGFTACCARGARLLLPKTPEGAILASQPPEIRGMSVYNGSRFEDIWLDR